MTTPKNPNSPYIWDIQDARGYNNSMGHYKTRLETDFLNRHIGTDPLRILEVGGGSGRFAVPLAERGHSVTVADMSEEALNLLKRKDVPGINTVLGDFMTQTFDHQFDLVTGIESVQSITSVSMCELFAKINSLLRPNGWFVFTGLNNRSWRYFLHRIRGNDFGLYQASDPKGYCSALEESGFSNICIEGFVWMPFPATSNSSLVPGFAKIEQVFGLRKWINQSPWLMVSARRP